MNKKEFVEKLNALHPEERVLFRTTDGDMYSVTEVEIQQEEAPIYGIVVLDYFSGDDFAEIVRIRKEAQDKLDAAERDRIAAEEAAAAEALRIEEENVAAAIEAQRAKDAAIAAHIEERIKEQVAALFAVEAAKAEALRIETAQTDKAAKAVESE